MANQQLLDYVQQSIKNGTPLEQIRLSLLQNGWNNEDSSQAISQVSGQHNLQSPPQAVPTKKSFIPKILIGLVVLFILAGAGYFVFSKNKTQVQDKSFENDGEVFNKVVDAYKDIKSFEITGQASSLERGGQITGERAVFEHTMSTNFTGQIILPKILKTKSIVTDVVGGEGRKTETTNYTNETIIVDGKIFKGGEFGGKKIGWMLSEVIDDPLSKKFGLDKSVEFKKPSSWLTLNYAESLAYVGKEDNTYHYTVIPKKLAFTDATLFVGNNFFITIGPGVNGGRDSMIKGDIWINDKFQIVKEAYLISAYASEQDRVTYQQQEKEGLEIEVNYSNYNQTFKIEKPIDTTDIDKLYSDMQSGKDEKQAEKEYQDSLYAKTPDLASRDRDERRFNDVMIQISGTMFGLYEDSHDNKYPASLSELESSFGKVPIAPTPADGKCTEEQNKYKYTRTSPTSFKLTFCLGNERSPLPAGFQTLTEKGIACIDEPLDKPYYCFPK